MSLRSDFRFTFRIWRRFPVVVAVAALSLGLGVGATTTMFSVVNTVAFYELGFEDVDRLAVLWDTAPGTGFNRRPPRWDVAQAVLEHADSFEELGFSQLGGMPVTLTSPSGASRVSQVPIDGNPSGCWASRRSLGGCIERRISRTSSSRRGSARDRRQPRHLAAAHSSGSARSTPHGVGSG